MVRLLARAIGQRIEVHGPNIDNVNVDDDALHLHFTTADLSNNPSNHYNALIRFPLPPLQQNQQQQLGGQGGGQQGNVQQPPQGQQQVQQQPNQPQNNQQGGGQPPQGKQQQANQQELSALSSFASLKTTASSWLALLKKSGFMETVKAALLLQK